MLPVTSARTWKRSGCLRLFTKHFASRLTPSSLFWLDKWHSTQKLLLLPAILIPCQSWSFSLYPVSGVVVLPQSTAGIHFKRCVNGLVQLVLIGNVASVHSFIHLPLSTHLFSIISYTIRIQSDLRLVPSSRPDFSLLTTSFRKMSLYVRLRNASIISTAHLQGLKSISKSPIWT